MSGYFFALALAVATLVWLFVLLRARRLREKYAFLWIGLSLAICVFGAFPRLLFFIADLTGVETPVNVLFSGAIVVLLMVSVQLSAESSRLEEETRTLAEAHALLQSRVERLEARGGVRTQHPEG